MQPVRAGSAGAHVAAAFRGAQLWIKRYNYANSSDDAQSVAVSPAGTVVYVTGDSDGDYATVAYDAATGGRLWAKRYNGPANQSDNAISVAASPDGQRVFVTGSTYGRGGSVDVDYATVAYNAATGAQLWVRFYNSTPGHGADYPSSMAVSPDSKTVVVTGDTATVAYNAATGAQLWIKRGNDWGRSVAVSPDSTRVFVTGSGPSATSGSDYATVAYNAATGTRLWGKRYNGPGNSDDTAYSVAVSPAGAAVYVTGESPGATSEAGYATVAYDAATGAQLWGKRYNGPGNDADSAASMAVSPTGDAVFVTGSSYGTTTTHTDYATIAYRG